MSSAKRDRKKIISVSACDIAERMFVMCSRWLWKKRRAGGDRQDEIGGADQVRKLLADLL
jgi:hypothetical protein